MGLRRAGDVWAHVGVFRGRLDEDVLSYLRGLPIFSLEQDQLEEGGMGVCRDKCHPVGHVYHEGCFHSRPETGSLMRLHPRFGCMMPIPAAPEPLRAFSEALRENMRSWLAEEVLPHTDRHGAGVAMLGRVLVRGMAFGSVAIQVHAGEGVDGSSMNWHCDNANSLLHLALGIRGTRVLHSLRRQEGGSVSRAERLIPGDVYISAPTLFDHAVEYPRADEWEDRVIAIQFRLLVDEEENDALMRIRGNDDATREFLCIWAEAIARLPGGLLPSLDQVQGIMRRWEEAA